MTLGSVKFSGSASGPLIKAEGAKLPKSLPYKWPEEAGNHDDFSMKLKFHCYKRYTILILAKDWT